MTRFIPVQDYVPASELKTRYEPPENLYIVVGGVVFPTYDFEHGVIISPTRDDLRAGRAFHPANMSSGRLQAHLSSINRACDASQFISAFEDDGRRVFVELASAWITGDVEVAMQTQPLCLRDALGDRISSPHAAKLIVNTSGLRPGWWGPSASLATIPVWYVDVPDASDASIWICVDKVRELFGLERRHGTRGEWLACGRIPRSMIDAQVVLQDHQRKLYRVRDEPRQGCGCPSIRRAASTQQAEHVREQAARNRVAKRKSHIGSVPEPRGATKQESRQKTKPKDNGGSLTPVHLAHSVFAARKQAIRDTDVRIPIVAAATAAAPRKRVRFADTEQIIEPCIPQKASRPLHSNQIKYASVRSHKLRRALEQAQVLRDASKDAKSISVSHRERSGGTRAAKRRVGSAECNAGRYSDIWLEIAGEGL